MLRASIAIPAACIYHAALCHLTYWPHPGLRPVEEGVKYIIPIAVYAAVVSLLIVLSTTEAL